VSNVFNIPVQNTSAEFKTLIAKAAKSLLNDGIVVMPSDTIYGVFAGYCEKQIERLHLLKKRPVDKPFLLVFPEEYPLEEFVDMKALDVIGSQAIDKISELWPGRNTIVLPKNPALKYPTGNTIAIRKPLKNDNVFFYETLNKYNKPLLAPSLNIHGSQPLVMLDEIKSIFSEIVDLIFYDQVFVPGLPSQIWDLTKKPVVRLR